MSAEKITQTRYRCICELRDCPGKGQPWISKDPLVPERCTWCGRRTWNGSDKRKNVFLTVNGKTLRLSEWANETGLSKQLIGHRLKAGWSDERAVTPVGEIEGRGKMSVKVFSISGERCDHCDVLNEQPVYAFKWSCPETGKQQLWLHKSCLQQLVEKVYRLEVKARDSKESHA